MPATVGVPEVPPTRHSGLYSTGITLFRTLAGRVPNRGPQGVERFSDLGRVHPDDAAFLDRLLLADPNARPTADEVGTWLAARHTSEPLPTLEGTPTFDGTGFDGPTHLSFS